jgi:hypothetical protein
MLNLLWVTLRELFARTMSVPALLELRRVPVVVRWQPRVVSRPPRRRTFDR